MDANVQTATPGAEGRRRAGTGRTTLERNGASDGRSALLGDELRPLIAEFMREAEAGRAQRADGQPYSREDLRDLRAALSHVDSELGSVHVEALRARHVQTLVDELRDAGLPEGRLSSIVEALRALFAYAIGRGLVGVSPVVGLAPQQAERAVDIRAEKPRNVGGEKPRNVRAEKPWTASAQERPTPTNAMLALTAHVVSWTVRLVVIAFALVVVVLIVEFA